MAGLHLEICFWYVDEPVIKEIVDLLEKGNYAPVYHKCRKAAQMEQYIKMGSTDLIIADFDLPDLLRNTIERLHSKIAFHVPLIYLVGERNEEQAADMLKRGAWDYLVKDHYLKLVPTVYSSQKYGKVLKHSKKVQSALEESREQFRTLAQNSPDLIIRYDHDIRYRFINRRITEYTGIDTEEYIGNRMSEMTVMHPEAVGLMENAIRTVFETGQEKTIELDFDFAGNRLIIEWRLFPEYDDEHEAATVLAIGRDITEAKHSSEAVRKSEERLAMAVEATSLGYWDWNLDNDRVFFSPIYFQMLGYGLDDLPQKLETWKRLLHPDDREKTIAFVEDFIRNREMNFEIEFRMQTRNGNYKWIIGRGRAVERREDGSIRRLIGTHEDISERKRNEQIQSTLFNISNAVNTTLNLQELYERIREYLGTIIDTTNCFLALYDPLHDMLSLPFHMDEKDSFAEFPPGKTLTGYVISTGKSQLVDAEREAKLTRQGHIELVGSPCVSWLGVPLKMDNRILGVFVVQSYSREVIYTEEDVSILEFVSDQIALAIKRKHDQENILENQEKQRRIFESSPDPIIVVDKQRKVIDYNTSLLGALNVTNEPVIGQNIIHFISREYWRQAILEFNRTWKEGYLKNLQYKLRRADGSVFDAEVSTGAIYNNEGKAESMVIIFKDITGRKEAERNLREAKERAEESDRLKTAFLSNMSHEIRTPMNAIVGFSDLLNDPDLDQHSRAEFIAQINLGADNLMHLIDDIIDISKIEAGQIKISKKRSFIRDLFREQMTQFKQQVERMDKQDLELRMSWQWPEKSLVLNTDQFRLKQIISNLVNNAIKFTDHGYVELGLERKDGQARFYVKDTGIGITPENQRVIFDRFMQGQHSKTKLYGGTGLGLAISRNLAELLGGEMGVSSIPGEGSEFWFTLPVDIPEDDQPVIQNEKSVSHASSWKGKTIMVSEDDESNFRLLEQALKKTKVRIIRSKSGQETIDLFRKHAHDIDLVLMDVRMPDIDGYECTRIIKSAQPDIPVIAQTAYAMSGEREFSREAGCDDYISKPLNIKSLFEKISNHLH